MWPGDDIKQSEGEASIMLGLLEMWNTPSLPSLQGPLWSGVLAPDDKWSRPVWYLKWVEINDLCLIELLEIEPFDHLTVCKQMNVV